MSELRSSGGAVLVGLTGSDADRTFRLDARSTVIGRDPQLCNLVFEKNVLSRRHASIDRDDLGSFVITDLGSRYGTYVNDRQVSVSPIVAGDRVGFGPGGALAFLFSIQDVGAQAHLRTEISSSGRTGWTNSPGAVQDGATPLPATGPLTGALVQALRIGRAVDNDVVLDSPGVSRYHATIRFDQGSAAMIGDVGSTNGTFVNGDPVLAPRIISPVDLVGIGGFLLRVDGRTVRQHDLSECRISAIDVSKTIAGKPILSGITLSISPREFVGVMGPSGCGKSTFVDALNGNRPATSGSVYVNELDLYRNFDALRRSIGHVPQRDVLHDALSVEDTLNFAARLRLPDSASGPALAATVAEAIATVGLEEHRSTAFRNLSGGQQKRLSLAIELLTKPNFIFLDEPTSPLDPETTENMMLLFRRLADEGRIVVMVTHRFERFELMHKVAILARGGRLAFYGPPREALEYFGCTQPGDIFKRISSGDADTLDRAFRQSATYHAHVEERLVEAAALARSTGRLRGDVPSTASSRRAGFRQFGTLCSRYLAVKLRDTRNTALLLAQAPIVAFILSVVTGDAVNDGKTIFIAAIISVWFGANNAIREIVSEGAIYVRERRVCLKIPSYVMSKFAVLSLVALVQCVLFMTILCVLGGFHWSNVFGLTITLYLTALGGVAMGLFFSAFVTSTEKAMSVLPLVLIPQLLLSGYIVPLGPLHAKTVIESRDGKQIPVAKPASADEYATSEKNPPTSEQARSGMPTVPEPVKKTANGMGTVGSAAAQLIVARWSLEALVNIVSADDTKARDALALGMKIPAYDAVFEKRSESDVVAAYRRRVGACWIALLAFGAVFLALTMLALRRKDVL